ncbi:MAG: hypothetical protein ABR538_08910 [Candidatus Binatia bacterium]
MTMFTSVRVLAASSLFAALLSPAPSAAGIVADVTTTTTNIASSSTFISTTTSSSLLQDYENMILLAVFPSAPIASLTLRIRAYPDYGPDDAYCVFFGPGSARTAYNGEKTFEFATLPGGVLDRSQSMLLCSYYTHEPHGSLSPSDFEVTTLVAKDLEGASVPTSICLTDWDEDFLAEPAADGCRDACGDAICDGGEPKASDALAVLRKALGLFECVAAICDVDGDGNVVASDALRVLRRSVLLPIPLLCATPGFCI